MRKTEYISTEFNRYGINSDRSENKIGYSYTKKGGKQDNLFKDQASQIEAIKNTFEEANTPVKKHYSKPGVYAVEEIMVLPDYDQAGFSFAQVIFDSDPMPTVKDSAQMQERAILKGMKDQDGNNFVAYFVPNEETLTQKITEESAGLDYTPEYEYKYACGREYSWTVQTKQTHGPEVEAYFFTQRDGVMYFCEIDTRVKLNRRAKPSNTSRNSILLLNHRVYTEDESKAIERRKNKLYDPYITGEFVPLEEELDEDEIEEPEAEIEEPEVEGESSEYKKENMEVDKKSSDSDDSENSDSGDSKVEKTGKEVEKSDDGTSESEENSD